MKSPPSVTSGTNTQVWMITGCSTGFGRHLAEYLLANDYRVVVTARKIEDIQDLNKSEALILELDVTKPDQITAAIKSAEHHFGRIDVLVNNAGVGYFAAVEEGEDAQIRRMFDINVFGMNNMIQAVLPSMRENKHGAIINISSIGGLCGFPALGFYNATKFAVEGLSEALWQEVEPLGIKVMLVEPSGFRTDWAGRSANESKQQIADYADTAGKTRTHLRSISGQQVGDPARAVEAIVKAMESPHPPHRLLLGKDAFETAKTKLAVLAQEFNAWEAVSRSADFPITVTQAVEDIML
jgi:NAD(P)-dependent dehydrogenase (short-subunit alcohol dehydrogenase family)